MVVAELGISAATYERVALRDPDGQWELHHGQLREKPGMSFTHNHLAFDLGVALRQQLDRGAFLVGVNGARLRVADDRYFVPDVGVIPAILAEPLKGRADKLEVYAEPLPLVVEIWSPSTGSYDISDKLAGYQERGDHEIWRIHPYDRTLTAWRRQADGGYTETRYHDDTVESASLPGVVIDLATLFE